MGPWGRDGIPCVRRRAAPRFDDLKIVPSGWPKRVARNPVKAFASPREGFFGAAKAKNFGR